MSRISDAAALMDESPDIAYGILSEQAREYPDDDKCLYLLGTLHARADRFGESLAIFERLSRLAPHRKAVWNALGQTLAELGKTSEARDAFKRAAAISNDPLFLSNIGSTYLTDANPAESIKWCRKALKIDPEHTGALANMGFAQLACGDWEGWQNVEKSLGGKFRKKLQLGDEPQWDGSNVDSLFVYGEQGIGDEIMYASCLEDAKKRAKHVTVECDTRLGGLFSRSFPDIEIQATRRIDRSDWSDDRKWDAGVAIGSLPHILRPTIDSCPRKPYLVADPERRIQWRALFDSYKRPTIGLCWSGGNYRTGKTRRKVGIEAFRNYIQDTNATFVSLQYKDAQDEIDESGLPVKQFRRATLTDDFDDTAALVAECDLVLGPHTTAHHLAGALGVPSTILIPEKPLWMYQYGTSMPFYGQQIYHRQRKDEAWLDCINRLERAFALKEAA
jgi:tetratricopeptide (TPR) repeat protein